MWHATVNTLCNDETLPELLKNIDIGLVEVPPSPTSVLTLREISDEFFTRFPDRMRDHQAVLETLEIHYLKKSRSHNNPDMFFGCVHAEAMLMGLLNYYSAHAGQDVEIQDPQRMQQIVQPVRSFHPSRILKLTFRGGGRSWDCVNRC